MWIDKLSLQEELETRRDLNLLSTERYILGIALLHELTGEKRVQDGIDILAECVNHEDLATANSQLDLLDPLPLTELNCDHFASFTAFNPLDSLELRINKKRVSAASDNNGSVFKRNSISW